MYYKYILNIILLPLKHSKLVSCKMNEVDLFMDKNLRVKKCKSNSSNKFKNDKYPNSNLFKVNDSFISNMDEYFQNHFPFLSKNVLFYIKDNYYNYTSDFRGWKFQHIKV